MGWSAYIDHIGGIQALSKAVYSLRVPNTNYIAELPQMFPSPTEGFYNSGLTHFGDKFHFIKLLLLSRGIN